MKYKIVEKRTTLGIGHWSCPIYLYIKRWWGWDQVYRKNFSNMKYNPNFTSVKDAEDYIKGLKSIENSGDYIGQVKITVLKEGEI